MQGFIVRTNNNDISPDEATEILRDMNRCKVITKRIEFEIAVRVSDEKKCHGRCPSYFDLSGRYEKPGKLCLRWNVPLKGDTHIHPWDRNANRCQQCLDAEEIGDARIDQG